VRILVVVPDALPLGEPVDPILGRLVPSRDGVLVVDRRDDRIYSAGKDFLDELGRGIRRPSDEPDARIPIVATELTKVVDPEDFGGRIGWIIDRCERVPRCAVGFDAFRVPYLYSSR